MRLARPAIEGRLVQPATGGGEQNPPTLPGGFERGCDRLDHHYHAGTTTERRIVHLPVGPQAEDSQIEQHDLHVPGRHGSLHDAHSEGGLEEAWEECDDRDSHAKATGDSGT